MSTACRLEEYALQAGGSKARGRSLAGVTRLLSSCPGVALRHPADPCTRLVTPATGAAQCSSAWDERPRVTWPLALDEIGLRRSMFLPSTARVARPEKAETVVLRSSITQPQLADFATSMRRRASLPSAAWQTFLWRRGRLASDARAMAHPLRRWRRTCVAAVPGAALMCRARPSHLRPAFRSRRHRRRASRPSRYGRVPRRGRRHARCNSCPLHPAIRRPCRKRRCAGHC
jgi:hypothetical protein